MEYSFFHPRLSIPCPFSIDWLTWGLERLLTRRSFNLMETKLGTMGRTWTQRARAAVQSEAPRGGGGVGGAVVGAPRGDGGGSSRRRR